MYHSITIGDKNTWDDWKLVATSRPVINPPEPRYTFIEVPGVDGKLDASLALTGEMMYDNRTGSWDFYVMNGYAEWQHRYSEIMNYLHGQEFKIVLEDDQHYFYQGRVKVNAWASEKERSKITLDYDLFPYKTEIQNSNEDWLWDPFDFEVGVIREFKEIVVEKNKIKEIAFVGSRKTIIPTITVTLDDGADMVVYWEGPTSGSCKLENGDNKIQALKIKDGITKLKFSGAGKVSISYQGGSL